MLLYYAIATLHVLVCVILVLVVLLQSGKGADLAGAFGGGATQTAFGSRGPASFLSKMTTIAAIVFMLTSMSLTKRPKERRRRRLKKRRPANRSLLRPRRRKLKGKSKSWRRPDSGRAQQLRARKRNRLQSLLNPSLPRRIRKRFIGRFSLRPRPSAEVVELADTPS